MLSVFKIKSCPSPTGLWHESTVLKSDHLAGVLRVITAFELVIPTQFYPVLAQSFQGQGSKNEPFGSHTDSNNVVKYAFILCKDVAL